MTVQTTGGTVATRGDSNPWGDDTGLEDLDQSDFVIPRLSIKHKEGHFHDNLSGESFAAIDAIVLGLVKQRIMWHPTVDKDDKPMCKSPDFNLGFPNIDNNPKGKTFPWNVSNFSPDQARVSPTMPGPDGQPLTIETNGHPVLPCGSCKFKEWETHPNGKNPWCSEQHTLPIMYRGADTDEPFALAILTLQKSGITPSKKYLTSFARTRSAPFTVITNLTLQMQSRGDTVYSTPVFKKSGETDRADWPEYAESYRSVREFVRQAPRPKDDDNGDDGSNAWAGPPDDANTTAAAAPAQAADPWAAAVPTPAPATQAGPAPDAEPVPANPTPAPTTPAPQPAPTPAPAPTPPPAPATPQPVAAAPVEVPAPAPAAPAPTPVAQPVAEAPAPAPAPAPVAPAAAADDDDLPF